MRRKRRCQEINWRSDLSRMQQFARDQAANTRYIRRHDNFFLSIIHPIISCIARELASYLFLSKTHTPRHRTRDLERYEYVTPGANEAQPLNAEGLSRGRRPSACLPVALPGMVVVVVVTRADIYLRRSCSKISPLLSLSININFFIHNSRQKKMKIMYIFDQIFFLYFN